MTDWKDKSNVKFVLMDFKSNESKQKFAWDQSIELRERQKWPQDDQIRIERKLQIWNQTKNNKTNKFSLENRGKNFNYN